MPLVRISVPEALSAEKVRALADAVHEGLVSTCKVPVKDRFQLISRFNQDAMILDPTFPDLKRSSEASVIEVLFLEGRTVEQKSALFRRVANEAVAAGFLADDIMITLTENATTDWSLGRGQSFGKNHVAH